MSNESSASETTPLRRPESRLSDDDVTTHSNYTPIHNNNQESTQNLLINNSVHKNSALQQIPVTPTTTTTAATSNDLLNSNNQIINIQRHTSINNNNNNNNIEHNNINNGNNNHNNNNNTIIMDNNKRILCRVALDVFILLCVGFPILCFFLWGDSYKRGFFCDDESLKHPFKDSTVRNWMLYIIGLVIPVGVIFTVEIIKSNDKAKKSNGNATTRRYIFMDYEIPDWLVECYKKIGIFGFGAAVSQLTTDIAKYSIGRLRPHFFTVCQPIMPDGSTCDDPINAGKYIEIFSCRGVGSTERMLKEMRLSFPSGHSSFTFFTMVYIALYLQSRMTWRGSKLFRHFLQFTLIMVAWYTALSRVSDYKHHWSDVLAGSAIGALVAVIVARYISDLFVDRPSKAYVLPRTSQDILQQTTITTNGH